ncbi:MAG TPA: PrgI family protein [Candidatus Angelobacter sp.]|nr:PrgI family protein [Candidatus Angelobacter sp.]
MSVYKVPQDVEAEDKLIGPFSFRQFIYLIIVALAIAIAWGLGQLFLPLAIIPLPIILFFGALALPLRKDQPMEIFLAAMLSFYLKPRLRLWNPDGIDSIIEITVPKTVETQRIKDLSQNEAERRFSYLANIVDSQGWAVRGPDIQAPNSAMNSDVYFAAQQVQDILDNDNDAVKTLNYKLGQSDAHRHQEIIDLMSGKSSTTSQPTMGVFDYFGGSNIEPATISEPIVDKKLEINPYPDIQQSVIEPIESVTKPSTTTSEKAVPAGIINLANNTDFSIETIAREANRLHEKQDLNEEVVISLR